MNDEYTVSKTPPGSRQGSSGSKLKKTEGKGVCKDFEEKCMRSESSSALTKEDSGIVEMPSTKCVDQSGLDTINSEADLLEQRNLIAQLLGLIKKMLIVLGKGVFVKLKKWMHRKEILKILAEQKMVMTMIICYDFHPQKLVLWL
ncbi:hypothetical protein Golob_026840 [Gossypium lobatum]|uniref:Uncharacterized protein n=1 Tax=Gossypium lobatum TaxID=34289 RepID=A0A7J8LWJ6_9ROSI|nr:hypothetical protein [Gossypium lobatum]